MTGNRLLKDLIAGTSHPQTISFQINHNSDEWHVTNPTIARKGAAVRLIGREVNYYCELTQEGKIRHHSPRKEPINSNSVLLCEDTGRSVRLEQWDAYRRRKQLPLGDEKSRHSPCTIEDMRLFWFQGCWRFIGCSLYQPWESPELFNQAGKAFGMVIGEICDDGLLENVHRVHGFGSNRTRQKNWSPLIYNQQLYFTYRLEPKIVLVSIDLESGLATGCDTLNPETDLTCPVLRGGSQWIPMGESHFLSIVHEQHILGPSRYDYVHRFACLTLAKDSQSGGIPKFEQLKLSKPFKLEGSAVEFAAGLQWESNRSALRITYGVMDQSARSVTVLLKELLSSTVWEQGKSPATGLHLADLPLENVFAEVYEKRVWGDGVSVPLSGGGSRTDFTKPYQDVLIAWLKAHPGLVVTDIGCGDWTFSRNIPWQALGVKRYIGIDIYPPLIESHQKKFAVPGAIEFLSGNALDPTFDIPSTDVIIIKDVMQHWQTAMVGKFLEKVKRTTPCRWMIVTNTSDYGNGADYKMNEKELGGGQPLSSKHPAFKGLKTDVLLNWGHHGDMKQTFVIQL